jgi:hypothetical protein
LRNVIPRKGDREEKEEDRRKREREKVGSKMITMNKLTPMFFTAVIYFCILYNAGHVVWLVYGGTSGAELPILQFQLHFSLPKWTGS